MHIITGSKDSSRAPFSFSTPAAGYTLWYPFTLSLAISRVQTSSSDEGLMLETSTLESLYGVQFTFSCQLC